MHLKFCNTVYNCHSSTLRPSPFLKFPKYIISYQRFLSIRYMLLLLEYLEISQYLSLTTLRFFRINNTESKSKILTLKNLGCCRSSTLTPSPRQEAMDHRGSTRGYCSSGSHGLAGTVYLLQVYPPPSPLTQESQDQEDAERGWRPVWPKGRKGKSLIN